MIKKIGRYLISAFFVCFLVFNYTNSQTANINTSVSISVCGNNVREGGEECDGIDFGSSSCESYGFAGGQFGCNPDCNIDSSNCEGIRSSGGGGVSGIGSGDYGLSVKERILKFSGFSYPEEKVSLLKDGEFYASTIADGDGNFSFTLKNLNKGQYIFSFYAHDNDGDRSNIYNKIVDLQDNLDIGEIFISPSLDLENKIIEKGKILKVWGQSYPKSDIIISINSKLFNTKTNNLGKYLYNLKTSDLSFGEHYISVKSLLNGLEGGTSEKQIFEVIYREYGTSHEQKKSEANNEKEKSKELGRKKGDLNNDGRIHIIDFSIAAYWYNKKSPPSSVDLNQDGTVNLVDFSIMAYYWTG